MVGGGVATTNDSGVWTGTAGNLQLVMREGDVAPGTGGLTFTNLTGVNTFLNANGSLYISNTLSNGDSSVWLWDPTFGLLCLVRNGDQIEVQPGVFRTSAGQVSNIQFTNDDGRPLSFANDGTIGLRVSNTDSATLSGSTFASGQVMTVRIGSLTGLPGKLSQAAGGTHSLYLNAGAANAGLTYIVAGSFSGTMPGTPDRRVQRSAQHRRLHGLDPPERERPAVRQHGRTLNADGRAVAHDRDPAVRARDRGHRRPSRLRRAGCLQQSRVRERGFPPRDHSLRDPVGPARPDPLRGAPLTADMNATSQELRTDRLRLRPWVAADAVPFAAMNADPRVTEYLPRTMTRGESDAMLARMRGHFDEHGFGLWAVEIPGVVPFADTLACRYPCSRRPSHRAWRSDGVSIASGGSWLRDGGSASRA